MSQLRVLVLGSYPAANPRHGGQIRLAQILKAYAGRGFAVKQASYFPAHAFYTQGSRLGAADVGLPVASLQSWRGRAAPLIEDLASGDVVSQDDKLLAALERFAGATDVVHLEQPWLLPVVHKLRERGALGRFRLVYGSQNIEHSLKREIFTQYQVQGGEPLLEAIAALERQCAQDADVVGAVTREDARAIAAWTAAPVVLAANGVAPWHSSEQARDRWRSRTGPEPFALYVASAHPPNVIGLCESFGECLGALSPVQTLVLAGSVTEHILASDWFKRWGALNQRRILAAGVLSDEDLSALRDLAHAFVLPMTSGGGSNLKTAEALYSGRHVVATPLAMRGFEDCAGLPGVVVAEPGLGYGKAVSHALTQPLPAASAEATQRRQGLAWSQTLTQLCGAVEHLQEVPA